MITHPRERNGSVERNPPVGKQGVHCGVEAFAEQERPLIDQVSHLHEIYGFNEIKNAMN